MEVVTLNGFRTLKLDLIFTLALAALFLFIGQFLQKRIRFLARSNIPAPAIGGLLFALMVLMLRNQGQVGVVPDTSLRSPLQIAFFTTVGLNATVALLRAGGKRMAFFWVIVSLTGVVQNIVGIAIARLARAPDAVGIICGSLTLTGGPATGMAFTDTFERLGIEGAGSLIIASATFGMVAASLVGNPIATALIRRFGLFVPPTSAGLSPDLETKGGKSAVNFSEGKRAHVAADLSGRVFLHNLLILLVVMGIGSVLGLALMRAGILLPGFIGPMIVAAVVRNMDDRRRWLKLDVVAIETIGVTSLALFFIIALMDLKLWQIAGLALPMFLILMAQIVVTVAYCVLVTFMLMGRDYEAAVTTSGHIGFGLGITPNAIANMDALTARFGPAPRSFLIVPVVGAFFIDFSNPLIITLFTNLIR